MSEVLAWEPTAEEAAQLQAQMTPELAGMKRLDEQMARDQREIELLRTETRAMLSNIHTVLAQIEAR